MNIKTAFLTSAAAAFLIAAPALAQDAASTPPASPDAAAAASSQQSLQLTPGVSVQGPDGELGKLEGVQTNASGAQELTVRGADGQVRAVPLNGIRQEGEAVKVDYTKAEFDAAAAIEGEASATPDATTPPADDAMTSPTAPEPTTAPDAAEPTPPTLPAEPAPTEPTDPATSSDPTTPPASPQGSTWAWRTARPRRLLTG